jgi:hypothetical protein
MSLTQGALGAMRETTGSNMDYKPVVQLLGTWKMQRE